MTRPWHRSPVLWFGLPGLIFLLLAWVDSMSNNTTVDATAFGRSVRFWNGNGVIGASGYRGHNPSRSGKHWDLQLHARSRKLDRGESWFPLPSYSPNHAFWASRWHDVKFSYWFLILVYLGLWQLPWLGRYHRRRRIERSLTATS
jgi:hypothetical protein